MFHVEQIQLIQEALNSKGISLPSEVLDQFRLYQDLLNAWNQKINLFSKSDQNRIITRHFLQSIGLLLVYSFSPRCRVLDLGTGAGFPGLPLKIVRPDLYLILVEATKKKAMVLKEIIQALHLSDIEIIPDRIENIKDRIPPVDIVVSRAVADLNKLVHWSWPCLKKRGGELIAIKGIGVDREIITLRIKATQDIVEGWKVIPYNPFPEFMNLTNSRVVVVRMANKKIKGNY
jgi:16S rRNA (guanine527-N7)-methyltransferase